MAINTPLVHSKDYIYNNLNEEEIVMMNINTGKYVSLNETGKLVWQLTEQPTTFDAIVAEFIRIYDITEDDCRKELVPFVEQLLEKKIIVNADN